MTEIPRRTLTTEGEKLRLPGFASALLADLRSGHFRYELVDELLRNIPGQLGRYLRYRVVAPRCGSCGKDVVIHTGVRLVGHHNLEIGDRVGFASDCFVQASGGLTIGDDTLFGPGVKVWTVNHLFADTTRVVGQQGYELKSVHIGRDCWLGADCFIKPGTELPDGCVVAPRSVVRRMEIQPYSFIEGSPAKVVGPRSRVGAILTWAPKGGTYGSEPNGF